MNKPILQQLKEVRTTSEVNMKPMVPFWTQIINALEAAEILCQHMEDVDDLRPSEFHAIEAFKEAMK